MMKGGSGFSGMEKVSYQKFLKNDLSRADGFKFVPEGRRILAGDEITGELEAYASQVIPQVLSGRSNLKAVTNQSNQRAMAKITVVVIFRQAGKGTGQLCSPISEFTEVRHKYIFHVRAGVSVDGVQVGREGGNIKLTKPLKVIKDQRLIVNIDSSEKVSHLILILVPRRHARADVIRDAHVRVPVRPFVQISLVAELTILQPCMAPFNAIIAPIPQHLPGSIVVPETKKPNIEPPEDLIRHVFREAVLMN